MILAWQCVRVYAKSMNDKRLPDIRKLLMRQEPVSDRKQTVEQQRAMLHMLAEQYGLRVRKQGETLPPRPPSPKRPVRPRGRRRA